MLVKTAAMKTAEKKNAQEKTASDESKILFQKNTRNKSKKKTARRTQKQFLPHDIE